MRNNSEIRLIYGKGLLGDSDEIFSNIKVGTISSTVLNLDWKDFCYVTLQKDDNNWVTVSGNLGPDGFSGVYSENGDIYVTIDAPDSVQSLIDILLLYFCDDDKFKPLFSGKSAYDSISDHDELKRYSDWKRKFDIEHKKENKITRIKTLISIVLTLTVTWLIYFTLSGEMKYLGQTTAETKGNIYKTGFVHLGKGQYVRRINYEFEYNDSLYRDYHIGMKVPLGIGVGDSIKIKFSTKKPERSDIIGYYRTVKQQKNTQTNGVRRSRMYKARSSDSSISID